MSMLTAVLEQCLEVQWADVYEVVAWDSESPPVCKEASQRAIEILKVLFNVTYSSHMQQPDEVQQITHRNPHTPLSPLSTALSKKQVITH